MRNINVNIQNHSPFLYPSSVLFTHIVCREIVCINGILQLCPHISLTQPTSLFSVSLTSYSCVPLCLEDFQYFIRSHASLDVNRLMLAFEEMCLHYDSYNLLNIFVTFMALLQLSSRTSALIPVIFISEKKTAIVSANASYRICQEHYFSRVNAIQ
jgi:hypothetical protein